MPLWPGKPGSVVAKRTSNRFKVGASSINCSQCPPPDAAAKTFLELSCICLVSSLLRRAKILAMTYGCVLTPVNSGSHHLKDKSHTCS
jgi:hypothetical protein